jgi:hypothetical protein
MLLHLSAKPKNEKVRYLPNMGEGKIDESGERGGKGVGKGTGEGGEVKSSTSSSSSPPITYCLSHYPFSPSFFSTTSYSSFFFFFSSSSFTSTFHSFSS